MNAAIEPPEDGEPLSEAENYAFWKMQLDDAVTESIVKLSMIAMEWSFKLDEKQAELDAEEARLREADQ